MLYKDAIATAVLKGQKSRPAEPNGFKQHKASMKRVTLRDFQLPVILMLH